MRTDKIKPSQGYVLLDVLLAVFLLSLGFAVLYGLTEGAVYEARQAADLIEGANLAQEKMERLAVHSWRENITSQACIPGGTMEGHEGKFRWLIHSQWGEIPKILRVSVEVRWIERGSPYQFKLESLYAVE